MNPEARNPFKFMTQTIEDTKQKMDKMKKTPQVLDALPQNDQRKKYLKAENKLLRESLKKMSENVNILLDKMNAEQLRAVKESPTKRSQKTENLILPAKQY
jgi:cell shape-determining protein MreC